MLQKNFNKIAGTGLQSALLGLMALSLTFASSTGTAAAKKKKYYMVKTVELPDGTKQKTYIPVKKVNGKWVRLNKRNILPRALPKSSSSKAALPTAATSAQKTPAANAGQIAAPQAIATAPAKKKSSWSIGYLNLASVGHENLKNNEGSVGTYNRLSVSNKFGTPFTFKLRPQFFINYNLEEGSTKHTMGDLRTEITKGGLFQVGAVKFGGGLRFDLPTGESSRGASRNGMAQAALFPSATMSKNLSYSGFWAGRYYLQSERAPFKGFDDKGAINATTGNISTRFIIENALSYKISDTFSIGPNLGLDYINRFSEPALSANDDSSAEVYGEVTLDINAADSLSFSLTATQAHNVLDDEAEFKFFDTEQISYTLVTSITFL